MISSFSGIALCGWLSCNSQIQTVAPSTPCSSEFFTFESKQSKKVTLFGENTAGVMDYGEVQNFNLSCGQYIVSLPWGRNGWIERFGFRIDNIGFRPDVPIPLTYHNWIKFVRDHWSK